MDDGSDIIDWVHFEKSRAELGPGFIRILSYFREDGAKSLALIEQAMHEQNTVALVISAVSRTHASHGCVKFTLSSGHSICACKPCVRCSQHTGGMFFRF